MVRLKIALSICTYFYRDLKCFCTQIWISSCLFSFCCPPVNVCFFSKLRERVRRWTLLPACQLRLSRGDFIFLFRRRERKGMGLVCICGFVSDFYVSGVLITVLRSGLSDAGRSHLGSFTHKMLEFDCVQCWCLEMVIENVIDASICEELDDFKE